VAVEIARCLSEPGGTQQLAASLPNLAMLFLVVSLFLPVLFGSFAFVMAATIRPICVALFCSVERFEQEYGSSRK
jgi:cytochrome c oxidase subunit IV